MSSKNEITVHLKRIVNLGNFQSMTVELGLTKDIKDMDEVDDIYATLESKLDDMLKPYEPGNEGGGEPDAPATKKNAEKAEKPAKEEKKAEKPTKKPEPEPEPTEGEDDITPDSIRLMNKKGLLELCEREGIENEVEMTLKAPELREAIIGVLFETVEGDTEGEPAEEEEPSEEKFADDDWD